MKSSRPLVYAFLAASLLLAAGFLAGRYFPAALKVRAEDNEPPQISEVKIKQITATSTIITWKTDKESDSVVNFGLTKNFGTARAPNPAVTDHEVAVADLDPSTNYVFRVVSQDPAGNQSFSGNFTFTTKGSKFISELDNVKNPDEKTITQKVVELIDKVKDETALKVINKEVQTQGEGVLTAPKIVGEPSVIVEAEEAIIKWQTDKEANGIIEFASDAEFNSGGYSRKEGDSDQMSTAHEVTLHGLRPITLYHFKITSQAEVGPVGESDDRIFTTKSILPQIQGARLQKVEEDSATVSWTTQVPAGGTVEYTNLNTKEMKSIGDPSLTLVHTIRLPDLKFKSPYQALIRARTQSGEEVVSQPLNFVTSKDESPPIISSVNNESTLYPDADAKVQTIVSWDTDEPSVCQLFYNTGVGEDGALSLAEETGALVKHAQVVTEFTPSTAYQFWIVCRDRNDNRARSENFVLFTPEREKSIIDIILENFQGTFGWVKNIGKK